MGLDLPGSANEVVQRAKTDVQRELVTSNPFLKNSWLGAIITGYGNRIFDFYLQLKEAIKQSFPDTATDDDLEHWASIWRINRLAASVSSGNIIATGTATTQIPSGTAYSSSDGLIYVSTATSTISAQVLAVTSLTRSGTTVTATTLGDHNLASNVPVTIAGADQTEYNVTDTEIQVTGLNAFTFQVTGTPTTPATGTITAAHTSTPVPVESQEFETTDLSVNQDADAPLTLQSPIVGVDDTANVDFGELGGGSVQETDTALQARLLDRIQNPIAHFNVAEITAVAKEVVGVTRAFVEEVTPAVGQVTVYFMRDNDVNPIPVASEVAKVDDKIQAIRPANTDVADVIVSAPTAVVTDFTFTSLSPNTSTMKDAVSENLRQFFDESTSVGVNIDQDAYRSAIFNTVDTATGGTVQTFSLSTPGGDIAIATGEIGVLGNVVYP